MKRLIVLSDSHGDVQGLRSAYEQARSRGKVDLLVFLGDGAGDLRALQPLLYADQVPYHAVRGNNDWGSDHPAEVCFLLNGVRFYACHGHAWQVKYTLDRLWYAAREREAQVALYGHTHREKIDLEHGVHFINPGAVCERHKGRSAYAEILVEDNGFIRPRLCPWDV